MTVSVGLHVSPLSSPKGVEDGRRPKTWSVSAQPDRRLVENDTHLELSYLLWEAESNLSLLHSSTLSAAKFFTDFDSESFEPAYPVLELGHCDTPTAILLRALSLH